MTKNIYIRTDKRIIFYIRQELCENICPISISRVYICPPKKHISFNVLRERVAKTRRRIKHLLTYVVFNLLLNSNSLL